MNRLFTRVAGGAAIAAGATAMLFAGPVAGAASAAPNTVKHAPAPSTKVPGTDCTLAQVEKALAKEDPALWHKLETNPKAKRRFEEHVIRAEHHKPGAHKGEHKGQHKKKPDAHKKPTAAQKAERKAIRAAIAKAEATCSRY
ncbi:hypothetical protein nbrc107696_19600 [Gordonia spumicola]|uniref:Hemophore-related protein n=1 Tax=Gordonia spumicola TaxID=589161 RepID=A0A7I9V8E8_9ACTN|nr:hypothetical protein [Gordonia spumicola]GEE01514.1 hypothetical protein nbrc107696_19600 [Gordonia spumicola]